MIDLRSRIGDWQVEVFVAVSCKDIIFDHLHETVTNWRYRSAKETTDWMEESQEPPHIYATVAESTKFV